MEKIAVIGSGISGLSISEMLSDRFDVQIFERSEKVGGLIKCDRINGNLFHRVGGHVFNSRNSIVLDWFWSHFDRGSEFHQAVRNAKILLNDHVIGYPLENYLYQLPSHQVGEIVEELIGISTQNSQDVANHTNFKEFLIANFGLKLFDLYFGPYNSKLWNTDISEVPLDWLDGKLPMPRINEIIVSNILKKEESEMVHSTFYYPVKNGSQFIIDRLAQGLKINLSYEVKSIEFPGAYLLINGKDEVDKVIYCGDVRRLKGIVKTDDVELETLLSAVTKLKSNGTSNVLCETDETDISWLYLPDQKYKAHRIIYTGNFSDSNNASRDRKTCVVEFSGKVDEDVMIEELSLLPGNLKPLAFNYEPNSYIIQDKDTRLKIERLKAVLERHQIYLLGRFAEWEYYNMDKCIESAMSLAKVI